MGLDPEMVSDCIVSQLDNDRTGGLADFPSATLHVGTEEFKNCNSENPRYLRTHLLHKPVIDRYEKSDISWFGFEARKIIICIEMIII